MNSFARDIKKFIYWYLLKHVLPFFPLKSIHLMGGVAGYLNSRLSASLRIAMYDELTIIFRGKYSEREKRAITRRAFNIMAKTRLEELLFKVLTLQKTNRFIRVDGLEKLKNSQAKGKGVVLVIAHFGANKLVGVRKGRP